MNLVIIERPYAGDVEMNVEYARECLKHSLMLGEAPIASHLLYTQPGVLDDLIPEQRAMGINAGLAWRRVADKAIFYNDLGYSGGMIAAKKIYEEEGFDIEERSIYA